MLDSDKTRLPAIRRVFELGLEEGIRKVRGMIKVLVLDNLEYAAVIKELVRYEKSRRIHDLERQSLINELRNLLDEKGANYAKRLSAYRGLIELGVTGIHVPQKDGYLWVTRSIISLAVLAVVLPLIFLMTHLGSFRIPSSLH